MTWAARIQLSEEKDYNSNYIRNSYVLEVGHMSPEGEIDIISIEFERYETEEIHECFHAACRSLDVEYSDYESVSNWSKWFYHIWPQFHRSISVDVSYYDDMGKKYKLDDIEYICL